MVHSQAKQKKLSHEKKLPEIVVQHFGEDMFDLGTPKDVEHMYKFVLSPRNSPSASARWNNVNMNWNEKMNIPYDTNSCVMLSPSPYSNLRQDTENWDAIFQANGAEDLLNGPETKLTDSFLTELGLKSPHSKVTLFSPKFPDNLFSSNFLSEIGLDHGQVTLVSPKEVNLISNKTPVVLRRQNEGKYELGIYLPPRYTPAVVDSIKSTINEEDLTMFPFPPVSDESVSEGSHLEDGEDAEINIPQSFLSCAREQNFSKQGACNDTYSNNNNNNNINNNNKDDVINNNCIPPQMFTNLHPGLCAPPPAASREGSALPGNFTSLAPNQHTTLKVISSSSRKPKLSSKGKKTKQTELRKQFKEVRILHNDVERKRRGEMQSRFQKLRESIPEIEMDHKAAKITILKVAKKFIRDLEEESRKMEQVKQYEKVRNRELLDCLCKLTGTSTTS